MCELCSITNLLLGRPRSWFVWQPALVGKYSETGDAEDGLVLPPPTHYQQETATQHRDHVFKHINASSDDDSDASRDAYGALPGLNWSASCSNCFHYYQSANRATKGVACVPTFQIIGANKAGTTSIYEYLSSHPEVHAAREKELQVGQRLHESSQDIVGQ
jgi:hypothetical protein